MSLGSYWLRSNERSPKTPVTKAMGLFALSGGELDTASHAFWLVPRELDQSDDWFRYRIVEGLRRTLNRAINTHEYRPGVIERIAKAVAVPRHERRDGNGRLEPVESWMRRMVGELTSWMDAFIKWQDQGGLT